jgi:hypothetical protein
MYFSFACAEGNRRRPVKTRPSTAQDRCFFIMKNLPVIESGGITPPVTKVADILNQAKTIP